eukprot:TRINITY_DN2787_c1_g1_i10.p1 TRINITY_DN2787_c1_g1~~TRINITY_DN2787_c1_g1_i10.p1  ORF type:complete len:267 (-),score=25.72 TRINITY_DN2787_c1_g1_i10:399-1199(-)
MSRVDRLKNSKKYLILLTCFVLVLKCEAADNSSSYLNSCMHRHDKCVFLIGMPHSGVARLLDILVQHPEVKMSGGNMGLFSRIVQSFRHSGGIEQQRKYADYVNNGEKFRLSWYNPEGTYDFQVALMQLFYEWYAKDNRKEDVVGFMEQSYGLSQQDYVYFKLDMMLLLKLCRSPKVILYLNRDFNQVTDHEVWYKQFPKPRLTLHRVSLFYERFHKENPQQTILVSKQKLLTNTSVVLNQMFQFLGVDINISEIQFNRTTNFELF